MKERVSLPCWAGNARKQRMEQTDTRTFFIMVTLVLLYEGSSGCKCKGASISYDRISHAIDGQSSGTGKNQVLLSENPL